MEDDVEVRNDSQQLQKTRAQDVKGKMSSPTINEKETEIHGTKCYEKEVKVDREMKINIPTKRPKLAISAKPISTLHKQASSPNQ